MNIVYETFTGLTIPFEQLKDFDEYTKQYYEGEILRKSEYYGLNIDLGQLELAAGTYYARANENVTEVVSNCLKETGNWRVYFDSDSNHLNETIWRHKNYVNGKFRYEGIEVFDSHKRVIAQCVKDKGTNKLYGKRKFFYGDPVIFEVAFKGAHALTFHYDDETGLPNYVSCDFGIFMDVSYNMEQFTREQRIMDLFPWNQHIYYHCFEPMLTEQQ